MPIGFIFGSNKFSRLLLYAVNATDLIGLMYSGFFFLLEKQLDTCKAINRIKGYKISFFIFLCLTHVLLHSIICYVNLF